jgi:hypothetical protein
VHDLAAGRELKLKDAAKIEWVANGHTVASEIGHGPCPPPGADGGAYGMRDADAIRRNPRTTSGENDSTASRADMRRAALLSQSEVGRAKQTSNRKFGFGSLGGLDEPSWDARIGVSALSGERDRFARP